MKSKLIFILILIHATCELTRSQEINCLRLQSYIDSLLLDTTIIKKSFEAMKLFNNSYLLWEEGNIITKENDTLIGLVLMEKRNINGLPIRVSFEDTSGKQKSYNADKIYKFNMGKKKYVSLKVESYSFFAQKVFEDKVNIYFVKYARTIKAVYLNPGIPVPYLKSGKDVFYFEKDNKISGPIKSNKLDSFLKHTCSCKIKYKKSDILNYDIYLILIYLNSQYY